MYLDFGDHKRVMVTVLVMEGDSNYALLLGYPQLKKLRIGLIAGLDQFEIHGYAHPLFKYDENRDTVVNSMDCSDSIKVKSYPTIVTTGITMRRTDEIQFPLAISLSEGEELEPGEAFHFCLEKSLMDKGISVVNPTVQILTYPRRKNRFGVIVYLRMDVDSKEDLISIETGEKIGYIKPYASLFNHEAMLLDECSGAANFIFCNTLEEAEAEVARQEESFEKTLKALKYKSFETVKNTLKAPGNEEHVDGIVFFLKKRVMTEKETQDMAKGRAERSEKFTEQKVKEYFGELFERITPYQGEAFMKLIMSQRTVLAENNYDTRHGCSLYMIDCLIPKQFTKHVEPYKISEYQRLLHARLQNALITNGVARPVSSVGLASHPFLLVKRGGKIPTDPEILLKMTDEELLLLYRIVFDNSSLTSSTERVQGDLPTFASCFAKMGNNSGRTLLDLKQSFYQIAITKKTSSLFTFPSSIPGISWMELCRLSQGFCQSSRLLILIMDIVAAQIDQIPFDLSWKEARPQIDMLQDEQKTTIDNKQCSLTFGTRAFMDDLMVSTPLSKETYDDFHIPDEALFQKPTCQEDRYFFLHLNVLQRLLYSLDRANILVNAKKTFVWVQGVPKTYLGLELFKESLSVPKKTRETLMALPSPKSVKDCQKILGLLCFFKNITSRASMHSDFLYSKLRKDQVFFWSDEDEKSLRALLKHTAEACMTGFLVLLDNSIKKVIIATSDWCKEKNSSSFICYVKYMENGELKISPAIVDSRKLPPSFAQKSSMYGELGALLSSLSFIQGPLLGPYPIMIYTDSMCLIYLVKRRFSAPSAINSAMVKRLLLALTNFHFILRYLPDPYMQASSDYLSRIDMERGQSTMDVLEHTTNMADFCDIDEKMRHIEKENLAEYDKRSKLNETMMLQIEQSKGYNRKELVSLFSSTHTFAESLEEANSANVAKEVEQALSTKDCPAELFVNPPLLPAAPTAADFSAADPFPVTDTDRVPVDEFEEKETNDTADLISELLPTNHVSSMTKAGIRRDMEDVRFIGQRQNLTETILQPIDGYESSEILSDGRSYCDHLHSVNLLKIYNENSDFKTTDEVLYDNISDIKANLNKAYLSNSVRAQKKYYLSIQKRERNLRLIHDLLQGKIEVSHSDVQTLRRMDEFFKSLVDSLDTLMLFEGLIWKIMIPTKHSVMRCLIVICPSDAERIARKKHGLYHRGVLFDFSFLATQFYTKDLLKICKSVQQSCVHCCLYFKNKRTLKSRLSTLSLEEGQVYIDLAGPIKTDMSSNDSKATAYVMVCLQPISWYVVLIFLTCKSSPYVWTRFLNEYLRYFPGTTKISMDNGGEFQTLREQAELLHISTHRTASFHPSANKCEIAVKKFSRTLSLFLDGNATSWKKNLAMIQIILNTSYSSPHTGMAPFYLQGAGQHNSFFGPSMIFRDKDSKGPKENPLSLMRSMTEKLREKYGIYQCPLDATVRTFESVGLGVDSAVFYKQHSAPVRGVTGMKKLVPKYVPGTITKLVGRTVAIIRSSKTGQLISRHISDVLKAQAPKTGPELPFWDHLRQISLEERGEDLKDYEAGEEAKENLRDLRNYKVTQEDVDEEQEKGKAKPKKTAPKGDESVETQAPRRSRRLKQLSPEKGGL